jgi:hypothetical protein
MSTPNPDHNFDIVADYGPGDTTPGLPPPYMIPYLLARRKELEEDGLLPPLPPDRLRLLLETAGMPIPDDLPPRAEPPKPEVNP